MVRYSNDSNGGLKTGMKNPVYGPKCLVFEWYAKSHDSTIWILDTYVSGIQVFGIQMVTVDHHSTSLV